MKIVLSILAALAAVGVPGVAAGKAAQQVELAGDVKVERTQIVGGVSQTVLQEPSEVVPGESLVFTTTYRNATGSPVENFVITNPLPDAVRLAEAGDFEVSVDGGTTYGALSKLTVADPAGATRAAGPADVTHLRWVLPQLAANATGTVGYRGIVR